jgi:cell wall-associated NlpC family hydrolase
MRKYVLRTLTFAALFCILLTVSVFAEEAEITGSEVNFRSGPGTDYAIYECLGKGTVVTVTDRSNSEWYGVTYNGHSGFVYSAYLDVYGAPAPAAPAEPEPAAAPAPAQTGASSGTVNAMYVRFRSGPSTDHSILGEYNSGTALTVTGSSDGWYAVVINGQSGYMYADYVTLGEGVQAPAETHVEAPVSTPAPTPAPVSAPAADGSTGHIRGDYVYFRSGPSTSYAIYEGLDDGTPLTITGRSGDWIAVTINGRSGYVYSSYVVSDSGTLPADTGNAEPEPAPVSTPAPAPASTAVQGYITGNDVRFRSGPSTRDDILGEYNYGTVLTITGSSGEWKAVTINGQSGYVYGQYVAEGRVTVIGDDPNVSERGRQIVEFALQYVGYPYTWGGTSPQTGFDCSGFTTFVFKNFGITLNRVACDQARNGVAVDTSALQPGDILCFYSSADYIGHVGIYIGDNRFVHSSTYTTGVIISELSGYYDTRGFIARRVI